MHERMSHPEISGTSASGWSPGETLEKSEKRCNFLLIYLFLLAGPCKKFGTPESLLPTNHWPKSLRTLDARLLTNKVILQKLKTSYDVVILS